MSDELPDAESCLVGLRRMSVRPAALMSLARGQPRGCQTTAILSYLDHSENVMGTSRGLVSRPDRFGPFLDGDCTGPFVPDVD